MFIRKILSTFLLLFFLLPSLLLSMNNDDDPSPHKHYTSSKRPDLDSAFIGISPKTSSLDENVPAPSSVPNVGEDISMSSLNSFHNICCNWILAGKEYGQRICSKVDFNEHRLYPVSSTNGGSTNCICVLICEDDALCEGCLLKNPVSGTLCCPLVSLCHLVTFPYFCFLSRIEYAE